MLHNAVQEAQPHQDCLILPIIHHISGRRLPSVYAAHRSTLEESVPPQLPPKPAWLRQGQGGRSLCNSVSSTASGSDLEDIRVLDEGSAVFVSSLNMYSDDWKSFVLNDAHKSIDEGMEEKILKPPFYPSKRNHNQQIIPPRLPPKSNRIRQRSQAQGKNCPEETQFCSLKESCNGSSLLDDERLDMFDVDTTDDSDEITECTDIKKNKRLMLIKNRIEADLAKNENIYLHIEDKLKSMLSHSDSKKFKSHAGDIELIATLVFNLLKRLIRVERDMDKNADDSNHELVQKRQKLLHQLEDAKCLKRFIEKRTISILNIIQKNLDNSSKKEFEEYVNNKIKLIGELKMLEERMT